MDNSVNAGTGLWRITADGRGADTRVTSNIAPPSDGRTSSAEGRQPDRPYSLQDTAAVVPRGPTLSAPW